MSNFSEKFESASVPAGGVALFWLEQSHFAMKTPSHRSIHVDPFLSRVIKPEQHIYPHPVIEPRDARADFVFLTHDHRDHTDPFTLGPMAETNPNCVFVGPPEAIAHCRKIGIADARLVPMVENAERDFGEFRARASYARDTGYGSPHETTHQAYVFDFGGVTIFHTGDTHCDVEAYCDRLEPVRDLAPDAMIVAINTGYGNPGPEGAAELVSIVRPRIVIPCHYDCFVDNTIDPQRFAEAMESRGMTDPRIVTLERGGMFMVEGA
jgi:L-ascorbate 6-phosphate lactonase